MDLQLKYQLAGAELRRASRVSISLTVQIPTALAMVELIDAFLAARVPTSVSKTRATVVAFREKITETLATFRLEETLRNRATLSSKAIAFPNVSAAAMFVVYNACLGGAHTLGKLTASAWAVRVEVNRFAELIEGNFPTMAELLTLAQSDERVDAPDPAGFKN